ncbi:response regulator [Hyphobacterium marinum]|uniref:Response regulator n=1 Tax=Hyphobacterium marinum TaxID=3116574 RepID=A0ABU7M1P9_9PROT|nr:response regulator [Hyphobacterium sp. Y6023]MEE2567695.1 response regulator [Hyphobacterium sp. Y6023]
MSYVDELAPHLAFLRRYARALTGSQSSGDAHVRAALEAAIADRSALDSGLPSRVALYKLFHTVWGSSSATLETPDDGSGGDGAEARLRRLSPKSRQALLLTSMEGFTPTEAAAVLGVEPEEVGGLVAEARTEIDAVLKTGVFIIEDEPIISADLQNIVRSLGHDVVGLARTRTEALERAPDAKPGLILADIQLADNSSGIDAVHDIMKVHNCPVIFITAFPERLLTGERPEPTYLITKPFLSEAVKAAIGQALFFA